jgi:hypothetical protein
MQKALERKFIVTQVVKKSHLQKLAAFGDIRRYLAERKFMAN